MCDTTDQTNAREYVGEAMRGRLDDLARLVRIYENPDDATEGDVAAAELPGEHVFDDHELQSGAGALSEAAHDRLFEYPLCVERTVQFEIVLGTGGPDDRLIVECDTVERVERTPLPPYSSCEEHSIGYEIRRILYRYSWEGSGEVELVGEDREVAERFARHVVSELVE